MKMPWFSKKEQKRTVPSITVRRFAAGQQANGLMGWVSATLSDFTNEIQMDLATVRTRSRDASINDTYARAYFSVGRNNIIGEKGIQARFTVRDANGKTDERANNMLSRSFAAWSRNATVDGLSFREAQKLFWQSWRRDGEVFVRLLEGRKFGPYGFQLQFLEPEHLDERYDSVNSQNGNIIQGGIEFGEYGQPVAYWLWKHLPTRRSTVFRTSNERIRVPADQIIHAYEKERSSQYRGFPVLAPALISLAHLNDYEKAELIAAKLSAAKMGFYTQEPTSDDPLAEEDDIDNQYTVHQEVEAGVFGVLPPGWKVSSFDTNHPNGNFGSFNKAILHGVSASVGMAYYSLSNDLQGTNYSGLRQGAISEREHWKNDQQFVIDHFCTPVFERWLSMALDTDNDLTLPAERYNKFNAVEWRTKTWAWVDPAKEAVAIRLRLQERLTSRSEVCRALGRDFEDVLQEISAENELMDRYGVKTQSVEDYLMEAINNGNKPEEE